MAPPCSRLVNCRPAGSDSLMTPQGEAQNDTRRTSLSICPTCCRSCHGAQLTLRISSVQPTGEVNCLLKSNFIYWTFCWWWIQKLPSAARLVHWMFLHQSLLCLLLIAQFMRGFPIKVPQWLKHHRAVQDSAFTSIWESETLFQFHKAVATAWWSSELNVVMMLERKTLTLHYHLVFAIWKDTGSLQRPLSNSREQVELY